MSRNFELLRRAENARRRGSYSAAASPATVPEFQDAADWRISSIHVDSGEEIQRNAARPSNSLGALEKQEVLRLATNIFRPGDPDAPRVVAITGLDDSTSAAHIVACAGELLSRQLDEPVCVVDADIYGAGLHNEFAIEDANGLTDALSAGGPITKYCTRVSNCLWVLSIGTATDAQQLLTRENIRGRLDELRRQFAYSLIVMPALKSASDALVIAPLVDGVVLVIDANSTRRDDAPGTRELLARAGIPILGAVLNNWETPLPRWLDALL